MKININDKEKVQAAIRDMEKKARVRLFDVDRIGPAIEATEKRLEGLGVAKKYWIGCRIHFQPERVPNKYATKGAAYGTYAIVERFSSGWFLVGVSRDRCESASYGCPEFEMLMLSDTAKTHIPIAWKLW